MHRTSAYCIVLTTLPSELEADALARQVIEARLGACVQLQPVTSLYRWQGELCKAQEWQLAIKTRQALFAALSRFITERHGYETPEIVKVPIINGAPGYLRWLDDETQDQPQAGTDGPGWIGPN